MKTSTLVEPGRISARSSFRFPKSGFDFGNPIVRTSEVEAGLRKSSKCSLRALTRPRSTVRRSGFTLIELLVVMGLIILLAAITITVSYSGLIDNYRTVGAGDRVSKWLVIAKVKAQRDRVPCGVRFYVGADGMIREAQYLEVPDSFVPVATDPTKPALLTITKGVPTVTVENVNTTTLGNNVQPGDTLVLPEFKLLTKVGKLAGADVTINTPTLVPDLGTGTKYSTTAFGFFREARPMAGEEMLLLTGQTAIDPALCQPPISTAAGSFFDVLFTPNGEVLNSTSGTVILWIRDTSLTPPSPGNRASYEAAGQMGLVTVYTKTGSIATHPVTLPPATDPYAATKDGINTGL